MSWLLIPKGFRLELTMKILQERLDYYRDHPEEVRAWKAVKASILGLS